jgi:general secretion pathway protein G
MSCVGAPCHSSFVILDDSHRRFCAATSLSLPDRLKNPQASEQERNVAMTRSNTQRKRTSRRSAHAGFTLIEVLLVLVILVILGSLAANVYTGTTDKASRQAAKANVNLVAGAIKYYHLHMNKYPAKLSDLWERPTDAKEAEKWGGPYLETALKPDPWGNEYQYTAQGKKNTDKYDFWSNGPDGQNGTDDDIGNWE